MYCSISWQSIPRGKKSPDSWDEEGLRVSTGNQFGLDIQNLELDFQTITYEDLADTLSSAVKKKFEDKAERVGEAYMSYQERMIMLQVLDVQWKDHLWALDHLKEGIGLRGYGQRDPLIEYKKESFQMFEELQARIEEETIRFPLSLRAHESRRNGRP